MQAIVQDDYGSPDVLRLEEVEVPPVEAGDVLVRVHAAGVDPGVWHIMAGLPYFARLMTGLRRPKGRIRGLDLAGTVEAVGAAVTDFRPGDAVFGSCDGVSQGSFAEYVSLSADRVASMPAGLTFMQAAAVPVSSVTALQGLRDLGRLRSGERVVITGAGGGVGTYAVQLAKAIGAEVTGVCSATRVDLVRSLGADEVIDYAKDDFSERAGRYDLILDTAGIRSPTRLRRALAPTGRLVIVGGEGGGRLLGGFDRQMVRAPLLSLVTSQRLRGLTARVQRRDLEVVRTFIERGEVRPIVDRTFSLAEAPAAGEVPPRGPSAWQAGARRRTANSRCGSRVAEPTWRWKLGEEPSGDVAKRAPSREWVAGSDSLRGMRLTAMQSLADGRKHGDREYRDEPARQAEVDGKDNDEALEERDHGEADVAFVGALPS